MKSLTPNDLKWLEQTLAKLQDDVTIVYFMMSRLSISQKRSIVDIANWNVIS